MEAVAHGEPGGGRGVSRWGEVGGADRWLHLMHLFILCLVSVLKVPGREEGREQDHAFIDTDKFHSPAGTLPSSVKNQKETKNKQTKEQKWWGNRKKRQCTNQKHCPPKNFYKINRSKLKCSYRGSGWREAGTHSAATVSPVLFNRIKMLQFL